jgi:signal transduction histidine kinase
MAVAAGVGEVLSLSLRRVDRFKVLYNGAGRAFAAAAGAATYWSLGPDQGVAAWPAALAGTLAFTLANLLATSVALGVVEQRPVRSVVAHGGPTALLAAAIAAPVGLVGLELWRESMLAPLVLVPLVGALAVNARDAAAGRREHELVAGLYDAARDASRLTKADTLAATVAGNVTDLIVASGAACMWRTKEGAWVGETVGDLEVVSWERAGAALAALAPGHEAVLERCDGFADGDGVLLVAREVDVAVDVVVVARRRQPDGRTPTPELSTLRALATHATLGLQNATLLAEVERALARQLDLNREKGEFVATVSHELRTPLAAMSGFVDTVMRLGDRLGPERSQAYLERALEQGGRLGRLIDDLLAVAAADHAQLRPDSGTIAVRDLLHDVRRTTSAVAGARLLLRIHEGTPATFVTDADKASRILVNLVENAAKYSDGRIRLEACGGPTHLDFMVEDDGPGIPEGQEDRIFQPFVQLDQSTTRRHGGTGLGLHLCRQLAAIIGAEVSFERPDTGGARFRLRFRGGDLGEMVEFEVGRADTTAGADPAPQVDEPAGVATDAMV